MALARKRRSGQVATAAEEAVRFLMAPAIAC